MVIVSFVFGYTTIMTTWSSIVLILTGAICYIDFYDSVSSSGVTVYHILLTVVFPQDYGNVYVSNIVVMVYGHLHTSISASLVSVYWYILVSGDRVVGCMLKVLKC